jgi:hypothetical protein
MSILRWNEWCQDHYVFTRIRIPKASGFDETNLYRLDDILVSQQKWNVATDGISLL